MKETDLKIIKLGRYNNIYFNKSKKFKSIGIRIVYKMKYDYKNISSFNLLCKYLGNCSESYPSIEQFNKYIDSLYGANVGIKMEYVGSIFSMNFSINFINPKFVDDDSLIENAIELLHDMIYKPLLTKEGFFDENIFNVCKQTCLVDAESSKEFNMGYVVRSLKEIISGSKQSSYAACSSGDKAILNKLDNKNILKYYEKMLHAPFDIYVTGEFSYKVMETLLRKHFSKTKIKNIDYDVFSLIEDKTYTPKIIKKPVTQAKLAVAYRIPVLFNDPRQYAFRIARLVLSGTLSAKFGKVIREKMGLCYSINSTYSSYYGTFIVTTGIESENISRVLNEIDNQINELKIGNVTDEEFNQAKEAIINDLRIVDDTLFGKLYFYKTYHQFTDNVSLDDEIKKYENVTKEEVIEVSKLLTYCTYCVLDKR